MGERNNSELTKSNNSRLSPSRKLLDEMDEKELILLLLRTPFSGALSVASSGVDNVASDAVKILFYCFEQFSKSNTHPRRKIAQGLRIPNQ